MLRKIVKGIPNTITSLNLLSGTLSIICIFNGDYKSTVLLIILAAIFDFFDGFAARLLKAYSAIGKELDSLADVISFGLAPSILLYHKMATMEGVATWITFIPLIIVIFSALRLARFNIDTRQSESFIGLATPACAMICILMIYTTEVAYPENPLFQTIINNSYFIPILSITLSALLVSEIPMFSLKMKSFKWADKENKLRYTFFILCIILTIISMIFSLNWALLGLVIFLIYLLVNILALLWK